jgi:hypothetical protein
LRVENRKINLDFPSIIRLFQEFLIIISNFIAMVDAIGFIFDELKIGKTQNQSKKFVKNSRKLNQSQ